jgi:Ser/Thr protein kinase RdoA (MazF antagonist)
VLARLHLAAAGFGGELPHMAPVRAQITDGLAALERDQVLDAAVLAVLRDRHAEVLAELAAADAGPAIVLHGDAHAGNLLHSAAGRPATGRPATGRPATGWLWTDLEETCRGPREFDLAVMAGSLGPGSGTALAVYATVTGTRPPGPEDLAPFGRARELEGTVWALGMAHQHPARYRDTARSMLDRVLHGVDGVP